jgi:rfaE bifunctional protein kinase chain/domain
MVLAQFNCEPNALVKAVAKFRRRRVVVVGDLMLDRFIWGAVSRISPEAPVPVVEIRRETSCLGGAANVAANIRSLGGTPVALGVVGADPEGKEVIAELRALGAPVRGVVIDRARSTTVKTRIIAHHQQVCRTDREDPTPISAALQEEIVARFREALTRSDAIVISDYAKGLLSFPLLRRMLPMARSSGKIVCVDPKKKSLASYRPATVITPNALEAEQASGISIKTADDLHRAGRKILRQTGAEHLLITRGEHGMALFEGRSRVTHIPTLAQEVFDVTGAGDTVISVLALGLAAGLSILEAAMLSNIAAGIVVGKLGTASLSPEELVAGIQRHAGEAR